MMKNYKRWVILLIGSLVLFVGLNAFIWKFFTEDILTFKKYYSGDLGRIGYIAGSKYYRRAESTLPRKHFENTEYHGQHVDVLTIGDSFSNIGSNGRDPLYQDWIASLHNMDVLNVQPMPGTSEMASMVYLVNSGYLDKVKPRFVIVETVERNCIEAPYVKLDLSLTGPLSTIEDYYRKTTYRFNPSDPGFVNTGNLKFLMNTILYRFSDRAFFSDVCVRDLNAPLFSVKNDRRLLFYRRDVTHLPLTSETAILQFNSDLNALADLLKAKGIVLYFMPAPDKYDLYSEYIRSNPYPKSRFFEILRQSPRRYVFVDTKALLLEEVRRGEKDIYYADDTHWSWKAAKKIVENLTF